MKVRVKADSRVISVTAFGGRHYSRDEWRPVPDGAEQEALNHPFLEVQPETPAPIEAQPEAKPVVKAKKVKANDGTRN